MLRKKKDTDVIRDKHIEMEKREKEGVNELEIGGGKGKFSST